jgi:hypothetical protein
MCVAGLISDSFKRWGDIHIAFQVMAFIVNLWALVALH